MKRLADAIVSLRPFSLAVPIRRPRWSGNDPPDAWPIGGEGTIRAPLVVVPMLHIVTLPPFRLSVAAEPRYNP